MLSLHATVFIYNVSHQIVMIHMYRNLHIVLKYSNSVRVVLDVPRRRRGHLTPLSALLLFYYALRRHIFNNLVNTPLCFLANQLLIVQNGTIIVEYKILFA